MNRASCCLASASLFIAATVAPVHRAHGDDEAAEVLRRSATAIVEAKTFAYAAHREPGGVLAHQLASVDGDVRIARVERADSLGARVWAKGEVRVPGREAPLPFVNAYDGAVYRSLREADRTLVESTPESGGRALFSDGADGVLLEPFVDRTPFAAELAGELSLRGESEVGGVRCVVIEARMLASSSFGRARWHIGIDDRLPRRVEMIYTFSAGEGVQTTSLIGLRLGMELGEEHFAVSTLDGYTRKSLEQSGSLLAVGTSAPDWELRDSSGSVHRLSDLKGRVVVMDFWATWCGPCRASMPSIQRVHERFKDRRVVVFGVEFKETGDAARYMREQGYTYTLLLDGDATGAQYRVAGIPVFYVIGADGRVAYAHAGTGEGTESNLAAAVEAALQAVE